MEERDEKSAEDKTEDATEERRKQFREEGNIANPKEITSVISLMVFVCYFYFGWKELIKSFHLSFQRAWSSFKNDYSTAESLLHFVGVVLYPLLPHLAILGFVGLVIPLSIALMLTKFNWSSKKIKLNLGKINPVPGIARIFSKGTLLEFVKIIIKLSAISTVIYMVVKYILNNLISFYSLNHFTYLSELNKNILYLFIAIIVVGLVLGLADYAFNLWKIERDMRMTKQEVKDDYKKQEGDPLVKSQRRHMGRQFILGKSIKDAAKATFIVTNPEHFAVAIRYGRGMGAPIVIAKGQDFLALKIREIAKKNDIIIVENKPLARTLYKTVKIGHEIPPSLYQSIIEVMKYIYRARGNKYFDRFNLQQMAGG